MLSAEEQRDFFEQGWVATRIQLDPATVARAIDLVWSLLPESFDRGDPDSWLGAVEDSCRTKDINSRRGRIKFRECVRKEPWLHGMLAGHPEALSAAESLLGAGSVAPPRWNRGLYPVFPSDPSGRLIPHGHLDTHPFQIGAVLYLSDVEPGGGGFHVWPGSHVPVALGHQSLHEDDPEPACLEYVETYQRKAAPVELCGPPGTLILWHQRLIHAAGINRSRTVRQALLCDFSRPDLPQLQGLSPQPDLWRHWAGAAILQTA